jgi:hypothetical protein
MFDMCSYEFENKERMFSWIALNDLSLQQKKRQIVSCEVRTGLLLLTRNECFKILMKPVWDTKDKILERPVLLIDIDKSVTDDIISVRCCQMCPH